MPPASDGWPEAWYGPGKSATSHYPNEQEAAQLWYHDHAMGINRLNVLRRHGWVVYDPRLI